MATSHQLVLCKIGTATRQLLTLVVLIGNPAIGRVVFIWLNMFSKRPNHWLRNAADLLDAANELPSDGAGDFLTELYDCIQRMPGNLKDMYFEDLEPSEIENFVQVAAFETAIIRLITAQAGLLVSRSGDGSSIATINASDLAPEMSFTSNSIVGALAGAILMHLIEANNTLTLKGIGSRRKIH